MHTGYPYKKPFYEILRQTGLIFAKLLCDHVGIRAFLEEGGADKLIYREPKLLNQLRSARARSEAGKPPLKGSQ